MIRQTLVHSTIHQRAATRLPPTVRHRALRVLWFGIALLTLHGCVTTPQPLDVDQQLQAELRRIENWQAEGKLGLRVGEDAQSANFDWQHQAESFSLRLSGPFGRGTTWLRGDGALITLESADQPLRSAKTAEQLMQEAVGWAVPVSNLSHWIKGIAAPGLPIQGLQRNSDTTLAELNQQGWHITYSRYTNQQGWVLPGKLVAERDHIRLTMIIKSWQLPDASHQ